MVGRCRARCRTDTVTVVAGDTVNIDAASETAGQLIIGSDPGTGGTAAAYNGRIDTTTATQVIVNAGVVVRLRGDLHMIGRDASNGAFTTLTMSSGSSLIWDPPSGGTYKHKIDYCCVVACNGTTNTGVWPDTAGGNHVIVKTDLTRGGTNCIPVLINGVPNTATVWGGFTSCTFTEFTNFGSSTVAGFLPYADITDLGHASVAMSITYCTFSNCSLYFLCEDTNASWTGTLDVQQ